MKMTSQIRVVLATLALQFAANADVTVTTEDHVASVSGTGTLTDAFLAPDITSVNFTSTAQIKYEPTTASTYAGGTQILRGQVAIKRGDALGSGVIELGASGEAALMARDADLTVANKVIFRQNDSYAAGYTDYSSLGLGRLTLTSIGTPSGASTHSIRLGRTLANTVSRVTLALTDENSEAIDSIRLSGSVALTVDGGTIKVRSDAKRPFFSQVVAGEDSSVTLATSGTTLDVASGGVLELGKPLVLMSGMRTNVVETMTPENHTFQNGSTGWTFVQGLDSESGVKTSPSPFDGSGANPPPGDDKHFAMLRRGASVSRTVSFPTAGYWRAVYYRGGRDGGYSLDVTLTVTIGDTVVQELPGISTLDFTEYKTDPIELAANQDYTFKIAAGSTGGSSHSLNVDCITFERVTIEEITGEIAKTGDGTWVLDGQDLAQNHIRVQDGELSLRNLTVGGQSTVSVADAATLRLFNVQLSDSVLNIADGGTLVLTDLETNPLSSHWMIAG